MFNAQFSMFEDERLQETRCPQFQTQDNKLFQNIVYGRISACSAVLFIFIPGADVEEGLGVKCVTRQVYKQLMQNPPGTAFLWPCGSFQLLRQMKMQLEK